MYIPPEKGEGIENKAETCHTITVSLSCNKSVGPTLYIYLDPKASNCPGQCLKKFRAHEAIAVLESRG